MEYAGYAELRGARRSGLLWMPWGCSVRHKALKEWLNKRRLLDKRRCKAVKELAHTEMERAEVRA